MQLFLKPEPPKWEKDYSKFVNDPRNREITEHGKRKILRTMPTKGWDPEHPIKVWLNDGSYDYKKGFKSYRSIPRGIYIIQSGGHRFDVAKAYGLPIYFVVADQPSEFLSNEQAENNWGNTDHVHTHIVQGKEDYEELKKFVAQYGLREGPAAGLLGGYYVDNGGMLKELKDGAFKVVNRNFAHKVAKWAVELFPLWSLSKTRTGLTTLARFFMVEGFDPVLLKSKLKLKAHMIHHCRGFDDCGAMLDEIYNHATRTDQRIPLYYKAKAMLADAIAKRVKRTSKKYADKKRAQKNDGPKAARRFPESSNPTSAVNTPFNRELQSQASAASIRFSKTKKTS